MSNKGCKCKQCVSCCWHNPGWFGSIEEIEGAAKLKGMEVKEFCKEYLIREHMTTDDDEEIIVPAPRRDFTRSKIKDEARSLIVKMEKKRNGKGFVKASWGHNMISGVPCIFLKNDLCTIHKSKPFECAATTHNSTDNNRVKVLEYWKNHQYFIIEMAR